MKHHPLLFVVIPVTVLAASACDSPPTCRYDETLVRVSTSSVGDDWACVPRGSTYGSSPAKPPSTSSPPSSSGGSTTPPTGGTSGPTPSGAGTSAPEDPTVPPAGSCGGVDAQGDAVRVVDKSDPAPAFQSGPGGAIADGNYDLVQASFFRTGATDSPVRSLKATLQVHGATLTLGAQDTSVAGQPMESLTFLLGSSSSTKTCESVHGNVSAWFFPFNVGDQGSTSVFFDENSGFLRLVVSRADGSTEMIFSR